MISIPVVLQTQADYMRALDKARNQEKYRPAVIGHLRGLLAGRWAYVYDRELSEGEEPDGASAEYKVVQDEESGDRAQLRRQEQPQAAIFQLGFTVAEVEAYISELEAK